ncbi:MAG: FeoB-associated Cys-rich membrane protein [Clostridia bacterium]|nr:FeoB-associated Cys-rich membrane protein [Clostridia bacterium]
MKDIIIVIILALIVVGVCLYIRKEKKKGSKCIGCPYGKSCSGNCQENKK